MAQEDIRGYDGGMQLNNYPTDTQDIIIKSFCLLVHCYKNTNNYGTMKFSSLFGRDNKRLEIVCNFYTYSSSN